MRFGNGVTGQGRRTVLMGWSAALSQMASCAPAWQGLQAKEGHVYRFLWKAAYQRASDNTRQVWSN